MITLKPSCKKINFKNMEKTRENYLLLMYGTDDIDTANRAIKSSKQLVESGHDTTGYFKSEMDFFISLTADQLYQSGGLPKGIKKSILQIIEGFTFWHSINEVDSDFFLAQSNYIHNLIDVSLTYMVSCELSKLFNNQEADFSLANIWEAESDNIKASAVTTPTEIDYITVQFEKNESNRDQAIKRFLDFRNDSVAHNNNSVGLLWPDFMHTMKFVLRAWGIINEYFSPEAFPASIQKSEELYAPLQPHFTPQQIQMMKDARLRLMKEMFLAASVNLTTGIADQITPFGDLKLEFS